MKKQDHSRLRLEKCTPSPPTRECESTQVN
jgi:hypothetical protein